MAYAPDRMTTTKLEASPSLLYNNCSCSATKLAIAHKDNVYTLDTRSMDGKVPATLDKVALREPLSGVMQVAWCTVAGQSLLVIATRAGFSVWSSDASKQLFSLTHSALGIHTDDTLYHFCRGICAIPSTDQLCIGTSWGDILIATVTGEAVSMGTPLRGHRAAINCIAADEKSIISGDDTGAIHVWDVPTMSYRLGYEGAGFPCTSIAVRGDIAIAGFASGYIRIYRVLISAAGKPMHHEVEIAAHARCVNAVDLHPTQYTFASVGEDCVVNVWSLPEMHSANKTRPSLDMTVRIADALLTGVQFARHAGKGAVPHIVVTAYDSHLLRVFWGL